MKTKARHCPPPKGLAADAALKPSSKKHILSVGIAGLMLIAASSTSNAGTFILSGTDSDEHGSFSAGANQAGWLYMQKALENLAPNVTNAFNKVVILGSSAGSALNAANSAASQFALTGAGAGWTSVNIDGTTAISDFFAGTSLVNINNAGIIMMDSGANVAGGATAAERALFTSNAGLLNSFLGGGGGLFSQANGFGFLTTLLPGVGITTIGGSGDLALTLDGNAAFPGLVNADLNTGPYHSEFTNVGAIPVLAKNTAGRNVIIGGGGTITNPVIPEPGTALFGLGLVGSILASRRRKRSAVI